MISRVAASERETAQTIAIWGCRNAICKRRVNGNAMESADEEGEIPVPASELISQRLLSTTGHEKSCRKQAGPSAKAK